MRHTNLKNLSKAVLLSATVCLSYLCGGLESSLVRADDWMTWGSTYTHDPYSRQRVDQYAPPVQPVAPFREDFQRSGFRHTRSTLQAGQSADNLHIVEQWGRAIVPYEEWRFPFRPYSVPYNAWGPEAPYGIINGNLGFGGGLGQPFPHPGFPGYPQPGYPQPGYPQPGNGMQPGSGMRPGMGMPGPWSPYGPGQVLPGPNGFPLQPQYQNQPWFDGTYPSAPPLDSTPDRQFFYDPRR